MKLSATLPDVSGENIECNVHGVRAEFLAIGSAAAQRVEPTSGAYFLGKALYTKGYRELLSAMSTYRDLHGGSGEVGIPHVDTYGSGPDFNEIVDEIDASQLPITPHTGIDHAHPTMHRYRVFVNPSTSDVLCTATAEALAMGKVVIIPDHPSNIFFKQFSNTVMYNDPIELVPLLREHLAKEPSSMSPREAYMCAWKLAYLLTSLSSFRHPCRLARPTYEHACKLSPRPGTAGQRTQRTHAPIPMPPCCCLTAHARTPHAQLSMATRRLHVHPPACPPACMTMWMLHWQTLSVHATSYPEPDPTPESKTLNPNPRP